MRRIETSRTRRVFLPLALGALLAGGVAITFAADDGEQETNGENTFRTYCRTCHGDSGKGDGPVAKALDKAPSDLTHIQARNQGKYPGDRIFRAIAEGKNVKGHDTQDMPGWQDAFARSRDELNEAQVKEKIQALVAYLKSIQG